MDGVPWPGLLDMHLRCVEAIGGSSIVKNDEFYRGAIATHGDEMLRLLRGRGYRAVVDRGTTGVLCLAVRR